MLHYAILEQDETIFYCSAGVERSVPCQERNEKVCRSLARTCGTAACSICTHFDKAINYAKLV